MTEIATIDWFGRSGTSVFSENTAIFILPILRKQLPFLIILSQVMDSNRQCPSSARPKFAKFEGAL